MAILAAAPTGAAQPPDENDSALASTPSDRRRVRADLARQVAELIQQRVEQSDVTGLTIAVQWRGVPLVTRSIGYADEPRGIKVNAHTGFRVGSITKVFTALSIMQMAENQELSLDDSIFTYLPDYQPKLLPGVDPDNRIRDLLTHHNGIPSWWLPGGNMDGPPSLEPLRALPKALSEDYLVENRREVHAYTNAAYSLLGLIVERVADIGYDTYIEQNFFEPLDMDDARVFLPAMRDNIALPHVGHQSWESVSIRGIPAGAIIASASDMHRFLQALIDSWHGADNTSIEAETLREMTEFQHDDVKYDLLEFMGLGFFLDQVHGYKRFGHNGLIETFSSDLRVVPELELGIFVFSNGWESRDLPGTLSREITAVVTSPSQASRTSTAVTATLANEPQALPHTGIHLINMDTLESRLIKLIQERDGAYLVTSSGRQRLVSIAEDTWQIAATPQMTLHHTQQFEGYYLKHARGSALSVPPASTELASPTWNRHLDRSYAADLPVRGTMVITLHYNATEHFYYTCTLFDSGLTIFSVQKTVRPGLIQKQGKGRFAGLVSEYRGDEGLYFSGLRFRPMTSPKSIGRRSCARQSQEMATLESLREALTTSPSSYAWSSHW